MPHGPKHIGVQPRPTTTYLTVYENDNYEGRSITITSIGDTVIPDWFGISSFKSVIATWYLMYNDDGQMLAVYGPSDTPVMDMQRPDRSVLGTLLGNDNTTDWNDCIRKITVTSTAPTQDQVTTLIGPVAIGDLP